MDGFRQMPKHKLCCLPDADPYLFVSVWLLVATSPLPAQEIVEPVEDALCVHRVC